eukprot:Clim_evm20s197 gene=Clim_evmTU20s197
MILSGRTELDQLGAQVVGIGNGSVLFANSFKKNTKWDYPVYRDPKSAVYKSIGLPRLSVWQALSRFLFNSAARAFYNGTLSKEHPSSDYKGDGQQTGGVFVVNKAGEFTFAFKEHENPPEKFADVQDIIAAVRKMNK